MTNEWAASWINYDATDASLTPVMLGGFLRSGTTLLDTILMSHPSTHVREEEAMIARLEDVAGDIGTLPRMTAQQAANLRDVYFNELKRGGLVPKGAILIDKNPLMTLRSAYIHRAFPDAKFIFALRHPCDVVLSCFMQNLRVTRGMASFLTLENAARFYDAAMSHWMRAREVLPLTYTVRYEDMVVDLEGQLRPLLDFLGLEDASLLDYRKTAKDRGHIRTPSCPGNRAAYTDRAGAGILSQAHGVQCCQHLSRDLTGSATWCNRYFRPYWCAPRAYGRLRHAGGLGALRLASRRADEGAVRRDRDPSDGSRESCVGR
jgi:hypothetical protein